MKQSCVTLLFIAIITVACGQTSSKKDNIKTLLELTGSGQLGQQVFKSMLTSYKQTMPSVPDEFWEALQKEIKPETLVDMIIPIYDKHYTEEEISQLTAFYQTTLGKKVIASTPMIMEESMSAGRVWGEELGQKVYENLKLKGYLKADQ